MTVTDEGPGIRGDISRIFQRFYTDRPDGEHFGDHSGLGLAISQADHRRASRYDQRCTIASDRSGAVFTVMLPARLRRTSAATEEVAMPTSNIHATGLVLGNDRVDPAEGRAARASRCWRSN